jgi:hypothetical protein
MTTIVASFYGPGPAVPRQAAELRLPAATTFSRRLARLRAMLIRDEQTRRSPPITLPRLEGGWLVERPIDLSAPNTPTPKATPPPATTSPPTIASILNAVAQHFGVPVNTLVGNWKGSRRPLEADVAVYLLRTSGQLEFATIATELGSSKGGVRGTVAKMRYRCAADPALAHALDAIVLELGLSRREIA